MPLGLWLAGCARCDAPYVTKHQVVPAFALQPDPLLPTGDLTLDPDEFDFYADEEDTLWFSLRAFRGSDTPRHWVRLMLSVPPPKALGTFGSGTLSLEKIKAVVIGCADGDPGWKDDGAYPLCNGGGELSPLRDTAEGVMLVTRYGVCIGDGCAASYEFSISVLGRGLGLLGTVAVDHEEEIRSQQCPFNVDPF